MIYAPRDCLQNKCDLFRLLFSFDVPLSKTAIFLSIDKLQPINVLDCLLVKNHCSSFTNMASLKVTSNVEWVMYYFLMTEKIRFIFYLLYILYCDIFEFRINSFVMNYSTMQE